MTQLWSSKVILKAVRKSFPTTIFINNMTHCMVEFQYCLLNTTLTETIIAENIMYHQMGKFRASWWLEMEANINHVPHSFDEKIHLLMQYKWQRSNNRGVWYNHMKRCPYFGQGHSWKYSIDCSLKTRPHIITCTATCLWLVCNQKQLQAVQSLCNQNHQICNKF